MKRRALSAALSFGVTVGVGFASALPATNYPHVVIANDLLEALVYLPDAENGYYRSTRFDWSSMVGQVRYNGHTYLGELKRPHNPAVPGHGVGLGGEFGMEAPLGYAEAQPGETFVKIGVGVLRKGNGKYFFDGNYQMARAFPWRVTRGGHWVCLEQELTGEHGWGYKYTKRVELLPGCPGMRVFHRLRNTGSKPIVTDHYSHNMFIFDNHPIGSEYRVRFSRAPMRISPDARAELKNTEVSFTAPVEGGAYWTVLEGLEGTTNFFRIDNTKLNVAVEVCTDLPVAHFALYAEPTALCPEPFVQVSVPPGEEIAWSTVLRFEGAVSAPQSPKN